ncbi:MAG: class I SAM-dependent methyltransferase [Hydrococcus sp. RM1_1_31]|nr:class I SAM-dependent methyltransferase [Hydrococcus sp. RM1_1_31]
MRDDEVEKVYDFAKKHNLFQKSPVILFECASRSGQSFVTPYYALYAAQLLLSRVPGCKIILSSHVPIPALDERIIDGSVLTLRENAELTKYCDLFVGCSSGVTLTTLTDWAKRLPKILLLKLSTSMYASIVHEFEYWGYSTELILEMWDAPIEELIDCVCTVLKEDFTTARKRFHKEVTIDFNYYLAYVRNFLLEQNEQYSKIACSLLHAVERYGWHRQLKLFVQTELMPKIDNLQSWPASDENYTQLLQNLIVQQGDYTTCKICKSKAYEFSRATVLGKYEIDYFQCSDCGFIQTEEPYWLEEAYSQAISASDVGLICRNLRLSTLAKYLIFNFFDHNGKFLDYGGGYGLLVRIMRDAGFDFYWSDKFCQNIFAEGFEAHQAEKNQFELVTVFEVFEHLVDPGEEIEKIFRFSKNILFSTEILPENNPKPNEWYYYALFAGQHVSIYTKKSLSLIAAKYNDNILFQTALAYIYLQKKVSLQICLIGCKEEK